MDRKDIVTVAKTENEENVRRLKSRSGAKKRRKSKSKKRSDPKAAYLTLTLVLFVFVGAVLASMFLYKNIFPDVEPDAVINVPLLPIENVDSQDTGLDGIGYGDVFRVKSAEELKNFAGSGKAGEFFDKNSYSPTLIISDGVVIKEDISFDSGVKLFFIGDVKFENGARIGIKTKNECEISIVSGAGYKNFYIDAPNAKLFWEGGDVPFSFEIAREYNVAEYNGSVPTDDGDVLGGKGEALISDVVLYTGKKKTEIADAEFSVSGNLLTLYYPYDFDYADVKGAYIDVVTDGECNLDTEKKVDLSEEQLIFVSDKNGEKRTYRLKAERKSYGIPILSIDTDSGKMIDSNLEYVRAKMMLDGEEYTLDIKGRGNASWRIFPKHAYRLKLDEKAKFFGLSSNRDWVLVSNYGDPSLIRNCVASDMAKSMENLGYTPTHTAVDLYINGEYQGLYMMADKIEEANGRVELGDPVYDEKGKPVDIGFLIEFGWDLSSDNVWGKDFFNTMYSKRLYIKEPKIEVANDDTFDYVYDHIRAVDKALEKGGDWKSLIDAESWADWFIVNELTNNTEGVFYRSLFMYKPAGGKITAGPIWDYDMAFGNHIHDIKNYDGWVSVDSTYEYLYKNWMYFLLRDDDFVSLVKSRWAEKKEELMAVAMESIDRNADVIRKAQPNNFAVWPKVLKYQVGVSTASLTVHSWEEHLTYIKDFLKMRYEWMDERLTREGSILD